MIELKKINNISLLSLVKNYLYMKGVIVSKKVYNLLKNSQCSGYITTNGIFIKLGATLSKKQFDNLKIKGNANNLFIKLTESSSYNQYVTIREYVTTSINEEDEKKEENDNINYLSLNIDENNRFYLEGQYVYKNKKYPIIIYDIKIFNQNKYIDDFVVMQAGESRLRVSISGNNCISGCKFCDFGKGYKKYINNFLNNSRMEEMKNKIEKILIDNPKKVNRLFITGGNPSIADLEKWSIFLEESIKIFKKYVPDGNVDVMLTPRGFDSYVYKENRNENYYKYVKYLKDLGVNTISPNMELWKQEKLNKFCPPNTGNLNTSKSEIGHSGYIDFIKLCIKIFGKYNVRTALIVGLNTNKEIKEAIDYLLEIGCFVVLSPFKTYNKTLKYLEPDIYSLVELGNYLNEKLKDIINSYSNKQARIYMKRVNNSLNSHNTHNTANLCCGKELDLIEKSCLYKL